jgi:hypothetical protein
MRVEIMLATIDLDHEAMLGANEIYDVRTERRLAPEMESAISPRPEMNP